MKLKRKESSNAGITLIALIITIVVLLILAVVTIRAVQGDGIITKAKQASTKYTKAQIDEEVKVLAYNEYLATNGASSALTLDQINAQDWITNGSATAVQDETTGEITITIPTTGETPETIVIPGKIVSTDNIYGKYYGIGSTDYYMEFKENGDAYATDLDDPTQIYNFTYKYDNGKITLFSKEDNTEQAEYNYAKIGSNNIAYIIESNGDGEMYTSNGVEGLKPDDAIYSGTINGVEGNLTISNGMGTFKKDNNIEPSQTGKYVVFNNKMYLAQSGVGIVEVFEISADGQTLTCVLDSGTLTKQ